MSGRDSVFSSRSIARRRRRDAVVDLLGDAVLVHLAARQLAGRSGRRRSPAHGRTRGELLVVRAGADDRHAAVGRRPDQRKICSREPRRRRPGSARAAAGASGSVCSHLASRRLLLVAAAERLVDEPRVLGASRRSAGAARHRPCPLAQLDPRAGNRPHLEHHVLADRQRPDAPSRWRSAGIRATPASSARCGVIDDRRSAHRRRASPAKHERAPNVVEAGAHRPVTPRTSPADLEVQLASLVRSARLTPRRSAALGLRAHELELRGGRPMRSSRPARPPRPRR